MNLEIVKIKSEQDNLELDVGIIKPEGEAKGIVQISHGMSEHKERYYPFMEYLSNLGYVTIINDHRGHGKSIINSEDKGYFYDNTSNYIVEDLHQITLYIKNRYPNLKVILFGHSMGSMVVRKYIKKYDDEIDKLIVCGSPSKNNLVGIAIIMTKFLTVFQGGHHRSKFINNLVFAVHSKDKKEQISDNSWICNNEEVVEKYNKDELCGFIFTLNGFENLFKLMRDIYSKKGWKLKNRDLPILFVAGAEDPIIVNKEKWKESQEFLRRIGYTNVEGKLYPNMRHELINEKAKDTVYNDIYNWINM